MSKKLEIKLKQEERDTLKKWLGAGKTEKRMVERAQIILLANGGKTPTEICNELGLATLTVYKWRRRFCNKGIEGLYDAERSGKPAIYGKGTDKSILEKIDEDPPEGYSCWNGPLLAEALGIGKDHVWKVLRKYGISLQRRRSWCISTDPQFAEKAADIVAIYLDPPDNAVVLCVDEKPSIQALERAQGWLKLPDGKAMKGFSSRYKRHGTTTLFAALEVATGLVKTGHYQRRRRKEFLDFMNQVIAEYPDKEMHVILDNLNTHKPKNDKWLQRHKNIHFHYTPTNASWLNQVEVWFSILTRSALKGSSFTSPKQVRKAIDKFVKVYNPKASPFEWTKENVYSVLPKKRYADLCS